MDTSNETVTAGPSMTFPGQMWASVVIGLRIFVVGGRDEDGNAYSVEYLDFTKPSDNEETNEETIGQVISSSVTWTTHSDLVLSSQRGKDTCAVVAVGSCLVVVAKQDFPTTKILDTHRNRAWYLPRVGHRLEGYRMVTVDNQVAVIGGWRNPSCATFPLMDKHT